VLFNPSPNQKRIVQEIAKKAKALVVMVKTGRDILMKSYDIPREKIAVIPHGVPNVHRVSAAAVKKSLGIPDSPVVSTFGLINRGKGIEYAIKAMPRIAAKHPKAIYLVLGETHPGVRHHEGESYRNELLNLVEDLGMQDHVRFNNRYLTHEELINYLCATDVYVTPYINRDQIVSGTLAYALGCGKAIVSTPYLYAEEVLADGRGIIVDLHDPASIADAAIEILSNPARREEMEAKAYRYGRRAAWFNVAIDYLDLFHTLFQQAKGPQAVGPTGKANSRRPAS
jgi:glycosyltransferase involved in cell wall biosynthesis